MPTPATNEQEHGIEHVSLEPRHVKRDRPIFTGIWAVYLGTLRTKTVPLIGSIAVERFGDRVRKDVSSAGITDYNFWSHDVLGDRIERWMVPDTHADRDVRGKPYRIVAHPDHLWQMAKMVDASGNPEFKIVGPPDEMRVLSNYFESLQRKEREQERTFSEVVTPT